MRVQWKKPFCAAQLIATNILLQHCPEVTLKGQVCAGLGSSSDYFSKPFCRNQAVRGVTHNASLLAGRGWLELALTSVAVASMMSCQGCCWYASLPMSALK